MKKSINKNFWNEKRGSYDYLAGECDYAEGLGLAFAVLFGIADIPTRMCPPSARAAYRIGRWAAPMPKADHVDPVGIRSFR